VRELREFRAHHDAFVARGITVAGISRDAPDSARRWRERLHLPYAVLSDPGGDAGRAFGIMRRIGLGAWKLELFRRSTFLIEAGGRVGAAWGKVKVRGHAAQVLAAADGLS
jgi:peroxiredoxin Q/BCP